MPTPLLSRIGLVRCSRRARRAERTPADYAETTDRSWTRSRPSHGVAAGASGPRMSSNSARTRSVRWCASRAHGGLAAVLLEQLAGEHPAAGPGGVQALGPDRGPQFAQGTLPPGQQVRPADHRGDGGRRGGGHAAVLDGGRAARRGQQGAQRLDHGPRLSQLGLQPVQVRGDEGVAGGCPSGLRRIRRGRMATDLFGDRAQRGHEQFREALRRGR
jgi:hypothetical protein